MIELEDFGVSRYCPNGPTFEDALMNGEEGTFRQGMELLQRFALSQQSSEACQFVKDGRCALTDFILREAIHSKQEIEAGL